MFGSKVIGCFNLKSQSKGIEIMILEESIQLQIEEDEQEKFRRWAHEKYPERLAPPLFVEILKVMMKAPSSTNAADTIIGVEVEGNADKTVNWFPFVKFNE